MRNFSRFFHSQMWMDARMADFFITLRDRADELCSSPPHTTVHGCVTHDAFMCLSEEEEDPNRRQCQQSIHDRQESSASSSLLAIHSDIYTQNTLCGTKITFTIDKFN